MVPAWLPGLITVGSVSTVQVKLTVLVVLAKLSVTSNEMEYAWRHVGVPVIAPAAVMLRPSPAAASVFDGSDQV